jgi:hypothetical protein
VTALVITVAALIAMVLGDPAQIIGLLTLAVLLNIAATC